MMMRAAALHVWQKMDQLVLNETLHHNIYNVFVVWIRRDDDDARYEILLTRAFDRVQEREYMMFPSALRDGRAESDWLLLSKASDAFRHDSYAAIRIFDNAREAEAQRKRAYPDGEWWSLKSFVAGAGWNYLFGQRIGNYMTDIIAPYLKTRITMD
jgi:hypothetical protein